MTPKPQPPKVKILFLDIDGVLNGHEWCHEADSHQIRGECVSRLNRVIRETRCSIVLSSAWRYVVHAGDMTPRGFEHMLRTHGLSSLGSIIGVTQEECGSPGIDERAVQCAQWLREHGDGVSVFAAVDDEDHQFGKHGIPSVKTDGTVGLTDADVDELIRILNLDVQ